MFLYLMAAEEQTVKAAHDGARRSFLGRFADRFEAGFHRLTDAYQSALDWILERRVVALSGFLAFALASLVLYPFVGRDFFPTVDAGQLRLHVRCPPGTRIEQSSLFPAGRGLHPHRQRSVGDQRQHQLPNNINLP
jgi:multidrug efflux pump subunit AcrB